MENLNIQSILNLEINSNRFIEGTENILTEVFSNENIADYQKETIAKLFCLNSKAFNLFNKVQEGLKEATPDKIFNLFTINSSNKWFLHKSHKKWFAEMYKYPWDRAFINNYVKTVKERKIFIDPNDFTGPIKP